MSRSSNCVCFAFLVVCVLLSFVSHACAMSVLADPKPHTFHNVTADAAASCQLADVYESLFYFVDNSGAKVQQFSLSAGSVFTYGLVIDPSNTFNMLYSLVCVKNDGTSQNTPKVAFVIGASGPADPNINIINYEGAVGSWVTAPGVGENFTFKFNKSQAK